MITRTWTVAQSKKSKVLVDTYRICMIDRHNLEHDDPVDSIYNGGVQKKLPRFPHHGRTTQ